ncbi:hypothetical protein HTZ97_13825 [Desulfuromonas acetoxidans]|uniref:Uncharacterized protein n=1 Tax=Desulfuromonas acetoxidans (strain DSM 684 / 11070) TaxID=281689 RepID=Q1K179_DESA6|nr:hypothetical protein [Desulfuromonas acetoxidans]EAT16129.1 hypothetical protein Dace_1593 [Desulfuromonas acetoxidans DSM 684]MBF0646435.1 hypothetical protein [Desulfuromonas acetoxidans]NVD25518.1 hypothetical protein [Desulfuromonas acetoxidans]NVE17532.1 hypothetical protein [Desulfuromonas acetoxidans]
MGPKDALRFINEVENLIGDKYRIYGLDLWPVIRNTFLSLIIDQGKHRCASSKPRMFSLACFFRSLKSLASIRRTDIFFLTDVKYSEKISGSVYLKDAHVLAEISREEGKRVAIGLTGCRLEDMLVDKDRCYLLSSIVYISSFVSRIPYLTKFFPEIEKCIDDFFSCVDQVRHKYKLKFEESDYRKQLVKNVLMCFSALFLLKKLLKKVRPSVAYLHCYYSVFGMAFCAACNDLGIIVADVQHGISGMNMRAYANWKSCPYDGYNTLPRVFLTWTSFDQNAIESWSNLSGGCHRAYLVGNLWRDYLADRWPVDSVKNEWSSFFDRISIYDLKIVVTLQSGFIDSNIVELARNISDRYCIIIRTHPDSDFNKVIADYSDVLTMDNVIFISASMVPVSILMKHMDLHITGWSASVYDAYFESVRSVIISRCGKEYFEELIDKNVAIPLMDEEVLLDVVYKNISTDIGIQDCINEDNVSRASQKKILTNLSEI